MIDQSTLSAQLIICPLCGSDIQHETIWLVEHEIEWTINDDSTHMWSCPCCPFVGLEFKNNIDIDRVSARLKMGSSFDAEEFANNLVMDTQFEDWTMEIQEDLDERMGR